MPEWTRAARVGLFALATAGAGYGIYRWISPSAGTEGGIVVHADLRDAVGLAPQSRVMMAGIPVGTIQAIRLENGKARVYVRMSPGVALHDDASIAKRSASLLGEYFLSLTPGAEGRPTLHDGDAIPNVLEQATTDQIMNDLASVTENVKKVSESLKNTIGSTEGEQQIRETLRNLQQVTDQLNQAVAENRQTIKDTIENVHTITERGKPEMLEILKNVREITEEVHGLVAENRGDVKGSVGDVRETVERVKRASASLESALAHIDSISGRIDRGEGTIGKLTKDETVVNEVQGVVEGANEFIGGISRLQTIVGLRSDYSFLSNTIKSYVELRLQPAEDKYYVIELINDPRGLTKFEQTDVDTTDPTRPSHYRDVKTTTTNSLRFTLQFARRLGPFTGRFGIKESTGGIGLDTHLLRDRFELRQDLFGFGEQLTPRWRVALAYEFIQRLWMIGGADDLLNQDRRDYFLGMQLRFNDQDLKGILPFAPKSF